MSRFWGDYLYVFATPQVAFLFLKGEKMEEKRTEKITVKVCDALCGQGKTSACISMMNYDTEHKYIFITPYLDEVERIKFSCAGRKFKSPEKKFQDGFSKLQNLHSLLRAGENIASTHALFHNYTDETKELIRAGEYILILDEVLDLFQEADVDQGDIDLLTRNGITTTEGDQVIWGDENYTGLAFKEIAQMSKSKNLIQYGKNFCFWALPVDVFRCFSEVYILTYLFEHQMLRFFLEYNDIGYELIGTKRAGVGYEFCPLREMDRRIELRDKIHINENPKYNEIGLERTSLSAAWFKKAQEEDGRPKIEVLKANIYNVFRGVDARDKMWTTLNRNRHLLKGKGYSNGFVPYNKRATNDFADRHYLAYCHNVYAHPWMKNYIQKEGGGVLNQDMFALCVFIQWIFRSAVRKGEEVWLYVPSRRMRTVLKVWLDNLARGEDLKEIKYNARCIGVSERTYEISRTMKNMKIRSKRKNEKLQ